MSSRHDLHNKTRNNRFWRLLPVFGIIGGGLAVCSLAIYASYNREIVAARKRLLTGSNIINTTRGPIEYATYGQGPPVLVIHGAGGGYDQGLIFAKDMVGDKYYSIMPSRSGYLRTPIPANGDASPAAQADDHAALLDALGIKGKVIVLGTSAGAMSSVEFSLRYPDRTAGLILIVPGLYYPSSSSSGDSRATEIASAKPILDMIVKNDFVFWVFMKLLGSTLKEPILGTPKALLDDLSQSEQQSVQKVIDTMYPISMRADGIMNDSKNVAAPSIYPYERINVPTLLVSAKDDLYDTYPAVKYVANLIPNAKFVQYERGGHLLLGHDSEVRDEVQKHLQLCVKSSKNLTSLQE